MLKVLSLICFFIVSTQVAIAGGPGQESCRSAEKIARCTPFYTDEAVECLLTELTNGKPSGSCMGIICGAAAAGCCACMKYQGACNAAKEFPDKGDKCVKGIKSWIIGHAKDLM